MVNQYSSSLILRMESMQPNKRSNTACNRNWPKHIPFNRLFEDNLLCKILTHYGCASRVVILGSDRDRKIRAGSGGRPWFCDTDFFGQLKIVRSTRDRVGKLLHYRLVNSRHHTQYLHISVCHRPSTVRWRISRPVYSYSILYSHTTVPAKLKLYVLTWNVLVIAFWLQWRIQHFRTSIQ